ncbi:hypothetical protein AXF42_Ash011346 [Apostasia shenzhenica]|uniref:Uncharacterized protein n=1 Tax=Apostasia shenzhenica TaxID=1088818 RepID=A0A2I0AED5_9ASPA|nr:hypothetical protein AXF42_Ash011346 [Apostasia shenzhenica]
MQSNVPNRSSHIIFQLKYINITNFSCVISVLYKIKVKLHIFSFNTIKTNYLIDILTNRCVIIGITLIYSVKITYYAINRTLNACTPLEFNVMQLIAAKTLLFNSNSLICHKSGPKRTYSLKTG